MDFRNYKIILKSPGPSYLNIISLKKGLEQYKFVEPEFHKESLEVYTMIKVKLPCFQALECKTLNQSRF
jgi:hypothetical protein